MTNEKGQDLGLSMAHPAQKSGKNPAAVGGRDDVTDSVARLAAIIEGKEAEQPDWLEGSIDLEDKDPLALVAETFAEPRRARGRGRPKGSSNLKNTRVFEYMEAMGHRDPAMTLSLIQTAPVHELAAILDCDKLDALKIQIAAAKELLPYKYAKRPTDINVTESKTHLFVAADIGSMIEPVEDKKTLSIFGGQVLEGIE